MAKDFFKFEDKEYDFPFLDNDPRFTTNNVVILLIGFLITFSMPFIIPSTGNTLLKAVIMAIVPLIAVVYVFKDDMSNIVRMPKPRDILIVILGFIMVLVFSWIANLLISIFGLAVLSDSAVNGAPLLLVIRAVIQLIGEELLKFIPLILVAAYLYKSIGRKEAIVVAIIVSQVLFSLSHIPAYGFSILFLLLHVGFSSLIIPIVYVKTKNLVLCYLIHVINDLWAFVPYFLAM